MRIVRVSWMVVFLTLGIFGFSANAAAAASEYPGWIANEGPLLVGESAAFTATNSTSMTLEASGLLTLSAAAGKCSITGSLKGTGSEAPDEIENAFLSCTGMTVKGSETCQVHSGKEAEGVFKSNKLKGTLAWVASAGGATGVILKPASGTELVSVVIQSKTGKACALSGTYLLSHEVLAKFLPVEEEVETAELTFPSSALLAYWSNASPRVEQKITQLAFGAKAATLTTAFAVKLQAGGKLGAAPKVPTKLCKVALTMMAPKCAAANVYGSTPAAKLKIEAVDEVEAQRVIQFALGPPPVTVIACNKSKLTAETEEPEAAPLNVKNLEIEYQVCNVEGAPANLCEVKMSNKPVNGQLAANPLSLGNGVLVSPLKLYFKCEAAGAVTVKCEYKVAHAGFVFAGGMIAAIRPIQLPLELEPIAGEAGCRPEMVWGAYYAVVKPQPAWVSG